MAHKVDQTIDVEARADGVLVSFLWQGRRYDICQVLERWREAGCWWDGEAQREVFRIRGAAGSIYELHRLTRGLFPLEAAPATDDVWILYRVED